MREEIRILKRAKEEELGDTMVENFKWEMSTFLNLHWRCRCPTSLGRTPTR